MFWWLGLLPHSEKVWGSNLSSDLSGWSLRVLLERVDFQSKDMFVRGTDQSEIATGVSVTGCVSVC